jgi:oxygen-independent coproporphyrinogen III oxidase
MSDTLLSLYIHVPFCLKKCDYCDFASSADSGIPLKEYAEGVVREMELRAGLLPDPVVSRTLYLGGGTPSLLPPELVARFISVARTLYGLLPDAEITLEANPGTVTRESLAGFRNAGVNRLSLGVQSFDDRMLTLLGRVHTAAEARDAVVAARGAGFDNLGLDLIHSLPGQTPQAWQEELRQAVELAPEHLSAYGLILEEGTPLHRLGEEGGFALPDDELGALMYRMTADILGATGYEQYEIANFARRGRRSRHNQVYWQRGSCLGFGAAAHSFLRNPSFGRRWHNPLDPTEYLSSLDMGKISEEESVVLTKRDAMSETFFLGLRMTDGVDTERFRESFGEDVRAVYGAEIDSLLDTGLLRSHAGRLSIPAPLLVLSNQVLVRFV